MNKLFTVLLVVLLNGCAWHPDKDLFTCPASPNYSKEVSKSAIISNMRTASQLMAISDSKVSKLLYFQPDDNYISAIHYCNTTLFFEAKKALESQLKEYRKQTKDKKEIDDMEKQYSMWLNFMDRLRIPRTPFRYHV
ncbi:hypothetical protein ACLH9T_004747 [Salmonella enterica]|nr:hypothetical protein [Salmonella enterica]EBG5027113.1 hypothetical protein [Salmonella enterica subsp. enterica serovar Oranienburg]ECK2142553.1 hypothetical protein [Salmonella enterica subsp. enterica serovar Enteritidis]EBB1607300.1 hypothetical protein [Salmonella enterica]EBB9533731.1 hypothetical protein [Salmonella enterica]